MTNILILDDDGNGRENAEALLRQEGFQVLSLKSAKHVLDRVTADQPDLVLVNVVTRSFDGLHVCRMLKVHPMTRTIPVLLMIGLGAEVDHADGQDAGADGFLTKPFDRAQLMKQVHLLVRQRTVPQSSAASSNG